MYSELDSFFNGLSYDEMEDVVKLLGIGVRTVESLYDQGVAEVYIDIGVIRDLSRILEVINAE